MESVKYEKSESREVANQVASCYTNSGPGGIRTPDHGIKSPALYLAKLLALENGGAGRIRTCDRPVMSRAL